MDLTLPTQRPRTCESEISSLESSSQTLSVEAIRHHDGISPSTPVDQEASQCHQRLQQQYATEHQPEPNAETFLLNEDGSTKEAANKISSPARWNALGLFAIGILVLGTVGIIVGMSLLAYIWRSSMRAQAGHIDNGQLWDLIVRENWTSVTVTITAAVIRVCLGFQMGIFTAMVASLLIERTGVPIGSAPLISMLRAVSTSPYNLVSRKTLTTPWGFAIGLAVLLTGASNFTSTALLVDFESFSIITPEQTIDLLYGSSGPEDASDPGSRDMSGNSAIGNLRGSKIWNSQPNSYFRFAELSSYDSTPDPDVDTVDDSGTILRAILPFANVSHRTNLRSYDDPSVVFDSRVKPKEEKTNERRGNGRPYQFHEVFVTGSFKIPNNPALFGADYNPFPRWTQASWLGNVWVSLSQVVSYETKDFIEKSTDQDDEAVAKMILKVSSAPGGESKYRVRVKCNESNGRNELSLI
ncbi:hypothetical protein CcaCcLH18_06079 [Colletotrichum camelliae]|nr:hypothetical protein CcaCcLH18_06079 [Colletotrichum camelliae]